MELESKLAFGGRVLLHVLRGGRIGAVRPYFICGCGHSGTTIVANILAGHPGVYTPLVETNAFLHGPRYARRTYLRLVLEASLAGKRVLIEKTPRHIRHLDLLRATVKNAKLIIPVRDGRDVAASITARFGNDLQAGINRWISDNQIVAAQLGRPDVFFFRYEDFVESPAGIISEICAFLGLPFKQTLLEHYAGSRNWFGKGDASGEPPSPDDHEAYRNWQINQPIFDGRGRWRSQYTDADMSGLVFQDPGRALMTKFGYIAEPGE